MHIYQVYVGATANSYFFTTRAKAKKFIKDVLYKKNVDLDDEDEYMTLEQYMYENCIGIEKIKVQ